MLFFLDHPRLVVFDDSLEKHLGRSSKDGLQLHPLTGLSEAWGMGLLDMPCLSLRSPHKLATSHSSSLQPQC